MDSEISWQAPEFEYHKKSVTWYWITIIVAVLLLAIVIWQKNFLFGVFIIIAEVLLIIWGSKEPEMIDFKLTAERFLIGKSKSYSYQEIENYAFDSPDHKEWAILVLKLKKTFRAKIKIRLPKTDLEKIRVAFQERASEALEVDFEHSFWDYLEDLVGF